MHAAALRLAPVLCLLGALAACTSSSAPAPAPPRAAATAPPAGGAAPAPTTSAASAPTAPPAATHVKIGEQSIAANTVIFIAADRGYFQQEGVDAELISFNDASQMIPALATEQIDSAGIAANPAMWNAVARGVSLKAVLDQATFRPGHGTTALLMRKAVYDSGRGHSLADLRGLTIAITPPGLGTTNACAMAPPSSVPAPPSPTSPSRPSPFRRCCPPSRTAPSTAPSPPSPS